MADFARGRAIAAENPSIDSDPEYEEWIAVVGRFHLARPRTVERRLATL